MAITEFDRGLAGRAHRAPPPGNARHGFDGQTVGALILAGWVWGVFAFLGWGLVHAAHLPLG